MRQVSTLPASVLEQYPKPDQAKLDALLAQEIAESRQKIIVLDDDPTGVQTVHDVSVYTGWDLDSIRAGFAEPNRLFFILTNSRGSTVEQTTRVHREIVRNILAVSRETGIDYQIMSRSDSTLRGHYPLETSLLREGLEADGGYRVDGEILCPFFKEGGRFTIGNVHYVRYGDQLVPAGETEFARDATFGYRASDLRDYIEEKSGGAYPADSVTCISLESLRALDFDGIARQLTAVHDFGKVVVNAIDACDVKAFSVALYRAMKAGRHFLFRTAAGLVKEFGGVSDRALLTHDELVPSGARRGGLVVVGSHTQKTTRQLEQLLTLPGLRELPFDSDLVLQGDQALEEEVRRVSARIGEAVAAGETAVVYTKRTLLTVPDDTKEKALVRSVKISDAVQSLVARLNEPPAFIVAKGGITSSDIGTKALRVKCARVMGQIRPGIPVWETDPESRFPQIPYVIFPGNVGEESTLREAVEILLG